MPGGLNLKVNILRITWVDDPIGGALETGTVVYRSVQSRIDYFTPKVISRDVGLESDKTYTFIIRPASIDIRPDDVIQIVFPPTHMDYNNRFRVRGIQRQSLHPSDPRGFIDVTVNRIEIRGMDTN